jgi:hypothetical protein
MLHSGKNGPAPGPGKIIGSLTFYRYIHHRLFSPPGPQWLVPGIYHIVAVRIDHLGIPVHGGPEVRQAVQVNMTVNQKSGLETPHKRKEAFKAPMTPVFLVMNTPG